ncbi:MAG: YggS family pyridoxal phosphate-dependent enzyme [Clostridiales bacterium]|nr:YggS family pyridoxal phosphate-dependent enzyme [Clostridiales bacterium]
MGSVGENIAEVRGRIAAAAERSGRTADDVTLVCVTKTRTVEEIREVIEAGECSLGENRVQEFLEKYDKVQDIADKSAKKPNIMWNLIGHLQRNKVKYLTGKVALVHSVDSFRLAEEFNARGAKAGVPTDVLIQLNMGGEAQKSGVSISDCRALVGEIAGCLPYVRIRGLMAVVPMADDPEDVRGYFRDAKLTFDALAKERGGLEAGFEHLSMGMTHDYEVAIEEGATMVRVGTAIFGLRKG